MELKEFVTNLNKSHFSLIVDNGKLNLVGDKNKLTRDEIQAIRSNHEIINFIKEHRDELVEYLTANTTAQPAHFTKTKDISSIYRLSGLQEGMLFHGLYNEHAEAYVGQFSCDISNVNLPAFAESWNYVLKQHSILRSAFYYDAFNIPVQSVHKEVKMPIEVVDFTSMTPKEQDAAISDYEKADRLKGFDFKKPPLIRIGFMRLSKDKYHMLWTTHHILFDGWSLPIMMEEFLSTYELILAGQPIRPKQEDLYEDYIRYIERRDKEQAEQYWRNYLKGVNQSTLLPFINNTSERTKGAGVYKSISFDIDKSTTEQIQFFAKTNRLTVNSIVQGVWAFLLHRYTGSNNVVYGVIVSGRPDDLPAVERRVGLYINTLPLHSTIDNKSTVVGWLQQLQNDQVKSREYQYSALHEVQRLTGVQGDLFDSLLVFENYPVSKIIGEKQWSLHFENVDMREQTNYPFTIIVNSAEQINIRFSFNDHLLTEAYVEQIRSHFEHVLLQIAVGAKAELDDIKLLTEQEEFRLLKEYNNTLALYPKNKTIVDLFEEQVQKTPNAIAAIFENKQITYRELNERSNQLGHYLKKLGVEAEALVPICIERSLEMIIGILGILKAGAAYVPVDPTYPTQRKAFMLEDTSASVIITNSGSKQALTLLTGPVNIIEIDKVVWNEQPTSNLNTIIHDHQLAYVIYTSGSTGKPKGVMIEHTNVYSFICWCFYEFASSDFNIVYASTSICFDLSIYEIFYPLTIGKQIRIIANGLEISKYLQNDTKVLTNSVPVVIDNLIKERADLSNISVINMAGEPIPPHLVQSLDTERIEVRNLYGPTEDTTYSTSYRIKKNSPILIGKPIANTKIFIINAQGQLSPIGVIGEICIGGAGLSRGYLNRPELTTEKFIADPFSKEEGARLYKTGDLGKWLPDGTLEYLGRIDDQVKIRGYRIELGEIESVLQQSGLVRQSVVVAKEDLKGNKRLVGYVVSNDSFTAEAITRFLNERLPDYMVPGVWVEMESLPLTSNGKTDKKALPNPEGLSQKTQPYTAPKNETEQKLVEIWQEILGVEKVGIHDNFFELGGHSILAMQVVSSLRRKLKLEVSIKDLFINPTISALSESLALIDRQTLQSTIKAVDPRPKNIPLSFSQERLYFIDQLEGSIAYHMPAVLRLKGKLNVEALQKSLQQIVERHEVLRTVIVEHEGQQSQVVLGADHWKMNVIEAVLDENVKNAQEQIQALIYRPFNLSTDYMLRADLITYSDEDNNLVVTMHHIAADGWSLSIIVKEIVELYRSFTGHRAPDLAELPIQYADYAIWQRNFLDSNTLNKKVSFWKETLKNVAPLNLPTDRPRPAVQTTNGNVEYFAIDNIRLQKLQSISKQHGATLFMTLLTTFKILLYRYTGQQDICVGTPTANRTYKEVEGLVGFFLNTLALRSTVDGRTSFSQLLEQVKKTTLDAFENQDLPFEKVVEVVIKERDTSRNALFQVMFILQNTPEVPRLQLGEVELIAEVFENKTSKFDLTFNLREVETGLQGAIFYNTDLFSKATIQRWVSHFDQVVYAIINEPGLKIAAIPLLSKNEEEMVLREFNPPVNHDLEERTLVELFEQQQLATANNVALKYGDQQLSYKELNERSNQLAHYLVKRNVKKGSLVPICIDRSFDMMVGILAILKSGAAYVPIDPEYPTERIGYMLLDTHAETVLTSQIHIDKLKATSANAYILAIDSTWKEIANESIERLGTILTGKDLAYVLYTSGSTGKPKGVQIEHNSIAQHLIWFTQQYHVTPNDSSYLISSFSFDGAMTAIWPVLVKGGVLHLPTSNELDPLGVLKYIAQNSISYIKTLPGIFKEIINADNFTDPDICKSIRLIILGGEKINTADVETYISHYPNVTFSNHYGPTECTVSSTFYLITRENVKEYGKQPVVGRAVANTSIYIVGETGLLNPIGVPGEICISGLGVAKGYLNNENLTKNKFVPDPFSNSEGGRMYKTGDIGRWLPGGNIEFIGRKDEQVKIRGYRVEPGEIESVLLEDPSVREAVVIAKEDHSGTNLLVAHIVPKDIFNKERTLAFLKDKLPGFMIPGLIVEMKSLPISPNGKVDKKALAEQSLTSAVKTEYQAPRNHTEEVVAIIWQALLKTEQVGVFDNFFEIGGHSLLAMRVVSSIRKQLHVELSIRSLFHYPTVAGLASFIQKQKTGILLPPIEVGLRPERIPLSFSQERLWFIHQLEGSVQYHIPAVLRLRGRLSVDALTYSLQEVVRRHEILRTVIREESGRGYQHIYENEQLELKVVHLNSTGQNQHQLEAFVFQEIKKPFDLSQDLMVRAVLIELDKEEHLLVITMHHIVSDGWSTSIFVNEVTELYKSYSQHTATALLPLKMQYADYALWQRNYLQGEVLDKKMGYWKEKLMDVSPLNMPTDYPRKPIQSANGAMANFAIEKKLSEGLALLGRQYKTTLFMTLLTAFKILLHKYTRQEDICVGTPVAGRMHEEVEGLIGFFINTVALRSKIDSSAKFSDVLAAVKKTSLEALEHQDVPFEKVVEAVVSDRDMSRRPVFQVMFVLQNTPQISTTRLDNIELSNELLPHNTSMFDFTLSIKETSEGLRGGIEYCTDLYSSDTIDKLICSFKELLTSIVGNSQEEVGCLRMINTEQEQQLLHAFNNQDIKYPTKTIVDLFEEQVQKAPQAIAVAFDYQQVTYLELSERANKLAMYLRSKGVKVGDCIPLCMERSIEMIVAIMGILKTGAAYVPIDVEYPEERIKFMLQDVAATLVVTTQSGSRRFSQLSGLELVEMDSDWSEIVRFEEKFEIGISPSSLAYIIYTSGSTGKPKGVMVEHGNVVSLVRDVNYVSLTDRDVLLSTGSPSFDATTFEYWGMLLNGAQLILCTEQKLLDNDLLKAEIANRKVTKMWFTSSWFNQIVNTDITVFAELQTILVGGEKLSERHIEKVREKYASLEIINGYGPTENTTFSLTYNIKNNYAVSSIPIGRPLSNRTAYIVDLRGQLMPIGVPGEIVLGGVGLSRGYLNRPELTAEKFINDKFSNNGALRLYRTGDLGRWLPDGNIEYLGRIDNQVKIRGYRIELQEIESVLQQSGLLSQSLVIVKEDVAGNRHLVAYVVPVEPFDELKIESFLKEHLPAYMIPGFFVKMDKFPLTANGKVDVVHLPDYRGGIKSTGCVEAGTETEKKLVEIWQELLGVASIGIEDNFFQLGGHSLMVMQLKSVIHQKLKVELEIKDLFQYPTIREIGKFLEIQSGNNQQGDLSEEFELLVI